MNSVKLALPWTGWLKQQKFIFHSLKTGNSNIKVPTRELTSLRCFLEEPHPDGEQPLLTSSPGRHPRRSPLPPPSAHLKMARAHPGLVPSA